MLAVPAPVDAPTALVPVGTDTEPFVTAVDPVAGVIRVSTPVASPALRAVEM
jgi:hypothetical protein